MNLRTLATLRAIIEYGSFSAASEVIGCTASAVSLQVKELEEFFGKPLFDRSTRSVKPTRLALDIANAFQSFSDQLHELQVRPTYTVSGRVRLGVITSMQSDFLPQVFRYVKEHHPSLELVIPPLNDTDQLLQQLKAGTLDVALVVRPPSGASTRLIWTDIHRQPFVMLVPKNAGDLSVSEIVKRYDWIAYDRSVSGGKTAADFLQDILPGIRCSVELRSIDAIVSLVSMGLGVTVIPRPRTPLLKAYEVQTVDLGKRSPFRQLSLVCRKADRDSRNIAAVVEAFSLAREGKTPTGL